MTDPAASAAHRQRVLFITGFPRSGSTLLTRLLGQVGGFFAAGEALAQVFGDCPRRSPCGCGSEVDECAFWQGTLDDIDIQARRFVSEDLRFRRLPALVSPWRTAAWRAREERFNLATREFYAGVAARSGAAIVVDSSKRPWYALALTRNPYLDVFAVHLVRDVRGVVTSTATAKGYLPPASAPLVVLWWSVMTAMSEWLRRRKGERGALLRYEDLVAAPEDAVRRLVSAVTGDVTSLPFVVGNVARLQPLHLLDGNPDKVTSGAIEIRQPNWTLSRWRQVWVTAATAPLLAWFGYVPRRNVASAVAMTRSKAAGGRS